ncbi:MAG: SDR family NAD(P)-dependent oxidoreductase [Thermoguttaceae bacterium]
MKHIITKSRVLLTGASSGIGAAIAFELAKENADMILLARRADRLDSVAQQIVEKFPQYDAEKGTRKIIAVVGDVTDPLVRMKVKEMAITKLGGIDILINNAGVGATSLIEMTTAETIRRLFEVNFFALLDLTQLIIPLLKESSCSAERQLLGVRPMIVNLSSIVGLRGVPHYGIYGAAKFAVSGLSESLRAELHRDEIDVLLVCPGTTQTEFFDVLCQASSAPKMPVHHAVTAEHVAKKIIVAIKKGKHKIIPYTQAVILDYLNRFAPRFTDWIMTKYV